MAESNTMSKGPLAGVIIQALFNGDRNVFSRILVSGSSLPVNGTTATQGTWMICGTGGSPAIFIKTTYLATTCVSTNWTRLI